ncbi:hypothetical protein E2I00_011589 [Balaenoptera physalus]|uniref:Uncharacterized protein n=1 Tax=Balaenoptera physalus TaxID=9770 RepID=A0A643C0U6_BALPH|nr:hypothetical protein E2I00_011589 [Balaenoptera physalus]
MVTVSRRLTDVAEQARSFLSVWAYPFKRVMDSYFGLSISSSTSNQI